MLNIACIADYHPMAGIAGHVNRGKVDLRGKIPAATPGGA